MPFDCEFRADVRRQVCEQCADKVESPWRKTVGKIAAYPATARQNSLTNRLVRAHISHAKRSPKVDLRSALKEPSLIWRISDRNLMASMRP